MNKIKYKQTLEISPHKSRKIFVVLLLTTILLHSTKYSVVFTLAILVGVQWEVYLLRSVIYPFWC